MQLLVSDPGLGSTNRKLAQFFAIGHQHSGGQWRLWMPETTELQEESPWRPWAEREVLLSRPMQEPALVIGSQAKDLHWAEELYPRSQPKLQLLLGNDLRYWGLGVSAFPAIRVAVGQTLAESLRQTRPFREPIHDLPLAIDTEQLPRPWLPKLQQVVILGHHQPALGQAVQLQLQQRGVSCLCELTAWPEARWQESLASSAVAVILPPKGAYAGLAQRRLAAMALGTALVVSPHSPDDGLLVDEGNALIRAADVDALTTAVTDLLDPGQLGRRERLLAGARACVQRHGPAYERLRWQDLMDGWAEAWQEAQRCHAEGS